MDEMNDQELRPDPLLGAAIRWAEGEVPLDEPDWSELRTKIHDRATLPLARRRAIEAASPRWGRRLIPVAAAAGLAVLVWTGLNGGGEATGDATPTAIAASPQTSIQEALLADVSDQEFRLLMAERNDADELLMIAVGQR